MRVISSMMVNTFQRDLSRNLRGMDRTQEQLSSGKRINKPSDDPAGITYALRYHTDITENEQYQKNVSDGLAWLDGTDSTLNEAEQALQRARELAVQGANGTNDPQALNSIAQEIEQIKQHLVSVANTQQNGRYLFSGTKTTTDSYDANGNYNGNTANIEYEISPGIKVPINLEGSSVFGDTNAGDSVFKALDDLKNKLQSGSTAGVSDSIGEIDSWLEKNLATRAEVGARVNRLEMARDRLESSNTNLNSLLSDTEDVDSAKAITELNMQENAYRATLAVGAKIIPPSLVDFLR